MFKIFFSDPIDFFCCCLTFVFYSIIVLFPALHISGRDIVSLSTRPASFDGDEEQIHSFVKGEIIKILLLLLHFGGIVSLDKELYSTLSLFTQVYKYGYRQHTAGE